MRKLNDWEWIPFVLAAIGAINWGLVGLFDFDLVAAIFGSMSVMSRIIYDLIGISGVIILVSAITLENTMGEGYTQRREERQEERREEREHDDERNE